MFGNEPAYFAQCGTEQEVGVRFEQEDGDARGGRARWWLRQASTSLTEVRKIVVASSGQADLHESDEGHDVLAVGAWGVVAGTSGDPGFENLGDGEEEPLDAFLNLLGRRAGGDRRQVANAPLGEDEKFTRGLDRPLKLSLNCIHGPLPLCNFDGAR